MQTSKEWWEATKNDPEALVEWLKKQYYGEVTAGFRIAELFIAKTNELPDHPKALTRIIGEEFLHAIWIKSLLLARGVTDFTTCNGTDRYWKEVLSDDSTQSLEELAAIAAHAETMRLERIRAIVADPTTPEDIWHVFRNILPMEAGHARIFNDLTTLEMLEATKDNHLKGVNALGLVI